MLQADLVDNGKGNEHVTKRVEEIHQTLNSRHLKDREIRKQQVCEQNAKETDSQDQPDPKDIPASEFQTEPKNHSTRRQGDKTYHRVVDVEEELLPITPCFDDGHENHRQSHY